MILVAVEVRPLLGLVLVGGEHRHRFRVQRHGVIDQLGAFGRAGERAERNIDLVGDEIRNALRRLGRHELGLDAERRGDLVADIDVEAFELVGLAVGAHRREIRIDADADRAGLNDLVERTGVRSLGQHDAADQRRGSDGEEFAQHEIVLFRRRGRHMVSL